MSTYSIKRILVATAAILSLLFMQWAVAAYACPNAVGATEMASAMGTASRVSNRATMQPNCGHLDMTQPVLCSAQAHAGDKIATGIRILKAPVAASGLWSSPIFPDHRSSTSGHNTYSPPGLFRAISPSLSVRDCRYLI